MAAAIGLRLGSWYKKQNKFVAIRQKLLKALNWLMEACALGGTHECKSELTKRCRNTHSGEKFIKIRNHAILYKKKICFLFIFDNAAELQSK